MFIIVCKLQFNQSTRQYSLVEPTADPQHNMLSNEITSVCCRETSRQPHQNSVTEDLQPLCAELDPDSSTAGRAAGASSHEDDDDERHARGGRFSSAAHWKETLKASL